MNKKLKSAYKTFVLSISLVGMFYLFTASNGYQPRIAPFVGSQAEPFRESGVFVRAKAYTRNESKAYLDRDLVQKGLQPVQITIQNNTERTYLLSNRGVDLSAVSSNSVATRLSLSALPRSIAFKIAAFFFWPFIIPATIDSIFSFQSHLKMRKDFYAKSVKDHEEVLAPYSVVNRIIFVSSKEHASSFTLYLKEQKSQSFHPFPVVIGA
ncbi:MAG: hypothetical protein KR126chlam1_01349 [Chlamydiae bacterium]|nr:hypothetical protein [Chlamydiota bacterium]